MRTKFEIKDKRKLTKRLEKQLKELEETFNTKDK